MKEQVQEETTVDYFAGSANYESMFAIIDNYLTKNWDLHKGRLLLAKIAKTLEQSEALQSCLKDPEKFSEKEIDTKCPISSEYSCYLMDILFIKLNFEVYVSQNYSKKI